MPSIWFWKCVLLPRAQLRCELTHRPVVDVRDVALAHIAAYVCHCLPPHTHRCLTIGQENAGTGQRFIVVNKSMWVVEIAQELKKILPDRPIVRISLLAFLTPYGSL